MKEKFKDKTIVIAIVALCIIGLVIGLTMKPKKKGNDDPKSGKVDNVKTKEKVVVKQNETKKIQYENYDNGLVKMQIPKGWKVDIGSGNYDKFMYYTFTAYNPSNPSYRIFFSLKTDGYMKTKKMRDWYKSKYPSAPFSVLPYIDPTTTENYYRNFTAGMRYFFGNSMNIPQINNFNKIEKIGTSMIGGDIIRATYKDEKGKTVDGIFTATLKEFSLYYVTAISVYNTVFFTAPENELTEWEPILNKCVSSIEFTETFTTAYYKAESNMMETIKANQKIYDQISNIITSGWEARQNTYDIISQKRSDATLGYERVYDTETGDIYKAYNGFTDDYTGSRYQPITDSMYNQATSGYIEKAGN